MDASKGLKNREQYEDEEWHAAVQLLRLSSSVPVVADDSPNSAAAAAAAAPATEVSSNNGLQAINSQHEKMEVDSKPKESKTDSDGYGKKNKFKKPDMILPCARCNSMKTKFCYFNNYNVNQPRHYCKDCKRYWTEGGSLRDVPIGSARRKNKQPSNRCPTTKPSDAKEDVPETSHRRSRVVKTLVLPGPAKENKAIASSGSMVVPCKSLCLGHNIEEQKNNTTDLVLGTDSLTLGKHPRQANLQEEEKIENTFWVPKALRVTIPEEAAKSTIWASLGIKDDEVIILRSQDKNGKAPESS